ncbi:apolipoprotein C-I [Amia ocellicauda]|uniref:apolipoprotein C-I n=1 Tax=Amia ocellicauda TaxID=2972642 RepID=UPI00346397E2|nr:APOC1 protein [Amia calva]
MKLPVALAVLVLVLATHTDAEEPTIEERFNTFQTQVKEFTAGLTDKTKAAVDQLQQSKFIVTTKDWFAEQFDKVKQKLDETFNKQ